MSIGMFYESEEWSNNELKRILEGYGMDVEMINISKIGLDDIDMGKFRLVVNRMFPSGIQRGLVDSSDKSFDIVEKLANLDIVSVNHLDSFKYDFSKILTYEKLGEAGVLVPIEYGRIDTKGEVALNEYFKYPLLLKPDCGGRSQNTYIIRDEKNFYEIIGKLPKLEFIL
jgi:ribosomal protein S6--L-glutamate ligase